MMMPSKWSGTISDEEAERARDTPSSPSVLLLFAAKELRDPRVSEPFGRKASSKKSRH